MSGESESWLTIAPGAPWSCDRPALAGLGPAGAAGLLHARATEALLKGAIAQCLDVVASAVARFLPEGPQPALELAMSRVRESLHFLREEIRAQHLPEVLANAVVVIWQVGNSDDFPGRGDLAMSSQAVLKSDDAVLRFSY